MDCKEKLKSRLEAYQKQKYQIHSIDKENARILMRRGYSKKGIAIGIDLKTGVTKVEEIRFV